MGTGFAVGYTGGLYLLNKAWYAQDEKTSFRFHNDNSHWNQLDKVGHFWTAFHQSRVGIDLLKWAGVKEKKAIWYGGMLGILMQTPIEIFDGYSEIYGASPGDMVANTLGSAAVIAQYLTWNSLRIVPKFSFHTTEYSPSRLDVLGDSFFDQMLKDYNGQTYWLSVDVKKFLPEKSKYPGFINIAIGYGAEGMLTGDPVLNRQLGMESYRKYYLSLDLNLLHFKTKSKFVNSLFYVVSILKFPAPALEYSSKNKFTFHPLYF